MRRDLYPHPASSAAPPCPGAGWHRASALLWMLLLGCPGDLFVVKSCRNRVQHGRRCLGASAGNSWTGSATQSHALQCIEPTRFDGHLLDHLGAHPELQLLQQIAKLIAVYK